MSYDGYTEQQLIMEIVECRKRIHLWELDLDSMDDDCVTEARIGIRAENRVLAELNTELERRR